MIKFILFIPGTSRYWWPSYLLHTLQQRMMNCLFSYLSAYTSQIFSQQIFLSRYRFFCFTGQLDTKSFRFKVVSIQNRFDTKSFWYRDVSIQVFSIQADSVEKLIVSRTLLKERGIHSPRMFFLVHPPAILVMLAIN